MWYLLDGWRDGDWVSILGFVMGNRPVWLVKRVVARVVR